MNQSSFVSCSLTEFSSVVQDKTNKKCEMIDLLDRLVLGSE